jgi:hypothetical protein
MKARADYLGGSGSGPLSENKSLTWPGPRTIRTDLWWYIMVCDDDMWWWCLMMQDDLHPSCTLRNRSLRKWDSGSFLNGLARVEFGYRRTHYTYHVYHVMYWEKCVFLQFGLLLFCFFGVFRCWLWFLFVCYFFVFVVLLYYGCVCYCACILFTIFCVFIHFIVGVCCCLLNCCICLRVVFFTYSHVCIA